MLNFKESIKKIQKIKTQSYCLIIGGEGTNKARSPKIWNKILYKNKINCKMIPLEVKKNQLKLLLDYLKKDKKFLGGSITKPYKEIVFNYLGKNIDVPTKKIGSVNCLFKKKTMMGINTDGIGFFKTLKNNNINKNYKNILTLGYGGAGKSILVYLKKYFSTKTKIYCSIRKNNSKLIKKNGGTWISWKNKDIFLKKYNMIINTTSLGFGKMQKKTPIRISKSNELKIVYDIIYNPNETTLLKNANKLGIRTINGLDMNIFQAYFAIKKVFGNKVKIKNFN